MDFTKNNALKCLLLDDDVKRTPSAIYGYTQNSVYLEEQWDIVRNYNEFVKYVEDNGVPHIFSTDHDLADIHKILPRKPSHRNVAGRNWQRPL